MTGREAILSRVREALSVPSDAHVRHAPAADASSDGFRAWLPAVGDAYVDRKALFSELSAKLKTEFITVSDREAAYQEVTRIAASEAWQRVAYHGNGLSAVAAERTGAALLTTDGGYDVNELESCDVGITECDAMIAQTGSVLVTTKSAGGRALSVLPPHHLVIATADQLVTDMSAGYAVLRERYGNRWPSFISFITGPSRTGDIERILVLGAHGPKKLTVLLIEDPKPSTE